MTEQLRKALTGMMPEQIAQIYWATVTAVDEAAETCTIKKLSSELEIDEILLSLNGSGVVAIPEQGSKVLVCVPELQKIQGFVFAVEKVKLYKIRGAGIELSGNELGGLVKIEALTSRLNSIESAFNQLLNGYKLHQHDKPVVPTNAATIGNELQQTQQGDIENTNVKHG